MLRDLARPRMNKKELAAQLNVFVRTVDNMVRDRRVSYVKIGRTVRFMWPDVEDDLKCRFRVAAHRL
jgi:excisionase family DNA binding protein